jgi:ligand-binding sensor domain-containing protein
MMYAMLVYSSPWHSLSHARVRVIHEDRADTLWVRTDGGGLSRFDPATGTFTYYRERDSLASDRSMAILEDGDAGDPAAGC